MWVPIRSFGFALWAWLASAESFDRVVVVIDGSVVTASDVALETELLLLDPSPYWSQERPPLDRVVDTLLLRGAAGDVAVYQPDEALVSTRFEQLRTRVPADQWKTWLETVGQDEESLRAVLRRRLIVERFLVRNTTTSVESREWSDECRALVERLRAASRIRVVPPVPREE